MVLCVQNGATKVVIHFDIAISLLCDHRIDLGRDLVPDSLVAAPVVVIVNEARDSAPQIGHVILQVQVYVFPLDGPPEEKK